MSRIGILDCTLRDGGYCNQWKFGHKNIIKIVQQLSNANIDIIECGFLTNKVDFNKNITKFPSLEAVELLLPNEKTNSSYVVMMNYGEYEVEDVPEYKNGMVSGIRVAFHKRDCKQALEVCSKLKEKGYKVFVQAMVSLNYTDDEFLTLIKRVNEIEPYAFYIVDSFGKMSENDVVRLFYLLENNLKNTIVIGFHSHNNMQMSFSNAQKLVYLPTKHKLLIDSSVYGMGRGAGNLNTELFVQYLNEHLDTSYAIEPLLIIIDSILYDCYQKNPWGYSLPNYLSAMHNIHPNYAEYLDNKKTLTIKEMNSIFSMLNKEKGSSFNKEYIEDLYQEYMSGDDIIYEEKLEISNLLQRRKVLLIAPGKSSYLEREKIIDFQQKYNPIVISVNFDYPYLISDYIFVSNLRRYYSLEERKEKCIVTSNIKAEDVYMTLVYKELLNNEDIVRDNAGLMAIKWLLNSRVKNIYLAGFDGYSYEVSENYMEDKLEIPSKKHILTAMNHGIKKVLKQFSEKAEIEWITNRKYI